MIFDCSNGDDFPWLKPMGVPWLARAKIVGSLKSHQSPLELSEIIPIKACKNHVKPYITRMYIYISIHIYIYPIKSHEFGLIRHSNPQEIPRWHPHPHKNHPFQDSMSDLGLALISSGTTIFLAMISDWDLGFFLWKDRLVGANLGYLRIFYGLIWFKKGMIMRKWWDNTGILMDIPSGNST